MESKNNAHFACIFINLKIIIWRLKTEKDEDKESIKGGWFSADEIEKLRKFGKLRALDMLDVIDAYENNSTIPMKGHGVRPYKTLNNDNKE